MASAWTTRLIDAPAEDLLSRSDVAKLLDLSEDTVKRLIADGKFPVGIPHGKQAFVWDWQDVAFYRLRMRLSARLTVDGSKITPPKPTETGGEPTETGAKPTQVK